MCSSEYHVASFVVRCKGEHADELVAAINALPGLEVHTVAGDKLVVTAEASGVRELAEGSDALRDLEHALAVAPVYHEFMEGGETSMALPQGEQDVLGTRIQ